MKRILFITIFLNSLTLFGQTNSLLIELLNKSFPESSKEEGRWVFYEDKGEITEINAPLVQQQLPDNRFYKVRLTNYLGWHINESYCLVRLDSITKDLELIEPLWYGGINRKFMKNFIGIQFNSGGELTDFLNELFDLLTTGSNMRFEPVVSEQPNELLYELQNFQASKWKVWRNFSVTLKGTEIKEFLSTNPVTNDRIKIK